MKLFTAATLLYKKIFSEKESDYASFILSEKIASLLYPKSVFSEYGKLWTEDEKFFKKYKEFDSSNLHSADRKYFMRDLLKLTDRLAGDTVECGAFQGASSWFICDYLRDKEKIHHIFDSFEGLPKKSDVDNEYWAEGDFKTDDKIITDNLKEFSFVKLYKGWIPKRFGEVEHKKFCFAHIDVDLYDPTRDSIEFFYPRMVSGGIILCDDYGFASCPGAKKAFDEFMQNKPEQIINVPTGQCFIIKK